MSGSWFRLIGTSAIGWRVQFQLTGTSAASWAEALLRAHVAGKLIYEFNLYGVVVPYSRRLLRLPSNLLKPD